MKPARIRILKLYNLLIAGVLAILGFATSCDPKDEYGTPSAKFIVNGKVTSSDTEEPIENIKVIMQGDTAYTDKNGEYQVVDNWGFPIDQSYNIQFNDIDGETNYKFKTLDTIVEFIDPEFSDGDGHWYSGETSNNLNVKLSPENGSN